MTSKLTFLPPAALLLITCLLAAPGHASAQLLDVSEAPLKGQATAPVAVLAFADYQCGYCARSLAEMVPRLEADYVKEGKVQFRFLDFPLDFHRHAFRAAQAARCAGEQGRFWEMNARLLANMQDLAPERLVEHGKAVGVDGAALEKCLEGGGHEKAIRRDLAMGKRSGVSGTPTYLVGYYRRDSGKVEVMKRLVGAQPYATVRQAIDELLAETPRGVEATKGAGDERAGNR